MVVNREAGLIKECVGLSVGSMEQRDREYARVVSTKGKELKNHICNHIALEPRKESRALSIDVVSKQQRNMNRYYCAVTLTR
jgi:hypothetical protein